MPHTKETRIPLHCACCGREVLAELVVTPKGRKVVIRARRHGQQHCVAISVPLLQPIGMPWERAFLTTGE